jgi:hypothetical protein
LEVQGVKCSSKNFQIDIEVKQVMMLNPIDIFEKCLLKKNNETLGVNSNISPREETKSTFDPKNETNTRYATNEISETIEKDINEDSNLLISEITENVSNEENTNEIREINFNLEELPEDDIVQLKQRNEVYYKMYKEAKRKAKIAKDLALSSYLEAKRIKNEYMLDDSECEDDDLEYEFDNLSETEK